MTAAVAYDTDLPQDYLSIGGLKAAAVTVTLASNDYVTGGIDVSAYVPGTVVGAFVIGNTGAGCVTQIPSFDVANKKLQLVKGTAGANAEVSNGTSDAQVVRLFVLGF